MKSTADIVGVALDGQLDNRASSPSTRAHLTRKWAVVIAKVLCSGLLLGAILSRVTLTKSVTLVEHVSGWSLILVLALLVVQFPIAAWRWRAVLNTCDVFPKFNRLQNLLWVAQFINQMMPTFVVGDAARTWYLVREGNPVGKVIRAVLLDRLAGIAGLILLLLMLTGPILNRVGGVSGLSIVTFAGGSIIVMIVGLVTGRFLIKSCALARWPAAAQLIVDAWRIVTDTRRLCLVFGAAIGSYVLASIATYILAFDLDVRLSLSDSITLVPIALLASIVPISFAGWGLRESAFVFLLGCVGISPEQSLALSICYGGAVLITALPGGFIWLALFVAARPLGARYSRSQ